MADVVTCSSCGSDNEAGRKFCGECGNTLVQTCPTCGTENAPAVKFCGECGSTLTAPAQAALPTPAPSAERRLVSILFADIVGHTSFSEARDAEDVRELLSRYFEGARTVIERYGGTVEKFIGDAVMAVWGAPIAQEDDAERAVRAALDLVAAVSALGAEVGAPDLRARAGVAYQQVENNLLQPLVYKRMVQLSPLTILCAVLAGADLAGVFGALVAIPIAGSLLAVGRELLAYRREQRLDPRGSAA